jgi:hypothetical protein
VRRSAWDAIGDFTASTWVRHASVGTLVIGALISVLILVTGRGESDPVTTAPPAASTASPAPRGAGVAPEPASATPAVPSAPPVLAGSPVAAPSTPAQWESVLAFLDERRARAYEKADPGLIDTVYVAGSEQRKIARWSQAWLPLGSGWSVCGSTTAMSGC